MIAHRPGESTFTAGRSRNRSFRMCVGRYGTSLTILVIWLFASSACAGGSQSGAVSGAPRSNQAVSTDVYDHEWLLRVGAGCQLYVRELGSGPLVVVLHDGWGMEHSYLVNGFRRLSDRYRFVFYDQRGSLRSSCDSMANIQGHVEDLDRLRVALKSDRLYLVAHGMGAYLAMHYAATHPNRVAALSLLAPIPARAADVKLPTGQDLQHRYRRPAVVAEFRRWGLSTERSATEPRARYLEHHIAKGAVFLHFVERWPELEGTLFYNPNVYTTVGTSPTDEDFTRALTALSIPIQVLFPEDHYLPFELSTRWVASVPNATLDTVPAAGHVLWIDQPKTFQAKLGSYLDRVVPKSLGK